MLQLLDIQERLIPRMPMVHPGETISFNCFSNREVMWTFNGDDEFPRNVKTYHDKHNSLKYVLNISSIKLENAGLYKCFAFHDNTLVFEAEAQLQIHGKLTLNFIKTILIT